MQTTTQPIFIKLRENVARKPHSG